MNALNLRPTFYRVRGRQEVLSGWQAMTTGDIYTVDDSGTGYALVPGAKPAFHKADRVLFAQAVDLYPTDFIEANERAVVACVDSLTGTVSFLLEGVHIGLGDNTLALTPHHDDDVALQVRRYSKAFRDRFRKPHSKVMSRPLSVFGGLATLLATVPISLALQRYVPEYQTSALFVCAVAWTVSALGHHAALVLALVSPLAYNLAMVEPVGRLTPLTTFEWVLAAFQLGVAIVFPWSLSKCEEIKSVSTGSMKQH
jgi:hypothetical protein